MHLLRRFYCRIPWVLSCSNYSNCAKTRWRPHLDRCSHWILGISRRVSLKLGILTSLRITATLGQRLEQTILAYHF